METPRGMFTVAKAAEAWIAMIQSPETKAAQEQKESLIAKIQAAVPLTPESNFEYGFVETVNRIRRTIRERGL